MVSLILLASDEAKLDATLFTHAEIGLPVEGRSFLVSEFHQFSW